MLLRILLSVVLLLSVSGSYARTLTNIIQRVSESGVQIVYSNEFINTDFIDVLDPIETLQELVTFLKSKSFELIEVHENIFFIRPEAQKEIIQTGAVVVGDVVDKLTGLSIANVDIMLDDEERITVSAVQSGYSFFIKQPGSHIIEVKHPDYDSARIALNLEAGQVLVEDITLIPKPQALGTISVTASLYDFTNQEVVNHSVLFQEELQRLPLLADDPVRAVEKLPGFTSTGLGTKPYVRGGKQNETQIVLNGLRLRNPYHYRDYLGVQSILNSSYVNDVSAYAGVFPVQYGGAISGVMEINSIQPHQRFFVDASAGRLNAYVTSGGVIGNDSSYLVSLRTGGRILEDVLNVQESDFPNFEDAFLNFRHDWDNGWSLDANYLHFNDKVRFEIRDALGDFFAVYNDNNVWFSLNKEFDQGHLLTNKIALQNISTSRQGSLGTLFSPGGMVGIDDTEVISFETQYTHQVSDQLMFDVGASIEKHQTERVYLLVSVGSDLFSQQLNPETAGLRLIQAVSNGNEKAKTFYANARYRWTDQIISDIGFRYDDQNWIEKSQFSPRINVSYIPNQQTVMKLGLGRHFQAQALDEALLEDGSEGYFNPESADIAVFEWSRLMGSGYVVRTEVYSKKYRQVHPYFENLFGRRRLEQELFTDRVKVSPTGGRAKGIDVSLSQKRDSFDWSVAYSYSDAIDIIDGQEVPRSWDQRSAIKADFSWQFNRFEFSALLNYHTGWPTTVVEDNASATIGERNGIRFGDYINVNAKLSYTTSFNRADVKYWAQVSNLLDRDNACCFNYRFELSGPLDQGFGLFFEEERWQPRLLNFGVSVYFE